MTDYRKPFLFRFFRFFFGVYLLIFGIKSFSEIGSSFKQIEEFLKNKKFLNIDLFSYSNEILVFEYCSFIYGGLLFLFGNRFSKIFLMIGFIIEIIFIVDILRLSENDRLRYLIKLLPLIGGTLSF